MPSIHISVHIYKLFESLCLYKNRVNLIKRGGIFVCSITEYEPAFGLHHDGDDGDHGDES